jgi:hypothetical protein
MEITKPKNGEWTVVDGEIKQRIPKLDKPFARSVDAIANTGKFTAYGFLKYAGPVGSVTSSLQAKEAEAYIKECINYCKKNEDKNKFFVQVDGYAGEQELPVMNEIIGKYSDRIHAGNTEQTIDWLNDL